MAIDRLPEDPESERALLSTICSPGAEQAAQECSAALRPDDFLTPAHRVVFEALRLVLDEGGEVSTIALKDALERTKTLARAGGYTGLCDILGGTEVGRPMVLAGILQRHRRRRELIRVGAQIMRLAQDDAESPEGITREAGASLSRIAMRLDRVGIRHIADISDDALASLVDAMNGVRSDCSWVKGWRRLNGMLTGFQPGQLIILAARPGIGKTALALNWLLGVTDYQKPAGVFSLEMPASALWRRLAAAHSGVDLRAMVDQKDAKAFGRVGQAKLDLDKRGIWIEDRAGITPREIQGEVDGLIARQPNLGLLVVDHLSLVSTEETARSARQNEATRVGDISRAFKLLAKDRKIPVLLLAQLNREVEHRQGNKPQLSDLRDSGAVEQDADVVMFIHRPGKEPRDRQATLLIAKQREGPTGEIPMDWDGPTTRFSEIERSTAPVYEEPEEFV